MIAFGRVGHVAAQDVDRERHAEPDVRQPHREEGAVQAGGAVELEQRHQRHLVGDDEQADDDDEDDVAALPLHEREGVGREGGDEDRDDRGRHRHDEAVDERLGHRDAGCVRGEHRAVVRESPRRPEGVEEGGPRPRRELLVPRSERVDEHAERRDHPRDAEDQQADADRPGGRPRAPPRLVRRLLGELRLVGGSACTWLERGVIVLPPQP